METESGKEGGMRGERGKREKKESGRDRDNLLTLIKNKKTCRHGGGYAVTRIRTWVVAATTRSTNHYTITASTPADW